jgi:hypothetical protein
MLLEKPIGATIRRLALPNATVMIVIGLLEVYFVSRQGVDALAGVAPVFPLKHLSRSGGPHGDAVASFHKTSLPESVTTRPAKAEAPTPDLIISPAPARSLWRFLGSRAREPDRPRNCHGSLH